MRSLGVEWGRKDKDKDDKDGVDNVIEVKGRGLALAAPASCARLRELGVYDAHVERDCGGAEI